MLPLASGMKMTSVEVSGIALKVTSAGTATQFTLNASGLPGGTAAQEETIRTELRLVVRNSTETDTEVMSDLAFDVQAIGSERFWIGYVGPRTSGLFLLGVFFSGRTRIFFTDV